MNINLKTKNNENNSDSSNDNNENEDNIYKCIDKVNIDSDIIIIEEYSLDQKESQKGTQKGSRNGAQKGVILHPSKSIDMLRKKKLSASGKSIHSNTPTNTNTNTHTDLIESNGISYPVSRGVPVPLPPSLPGR